jgi:VanZ family protein
MLKFDKNLVFYKLPPVLYAIMILAVTAVSTPSAPDIGVSWQDKIYHFLEYFIFGALVFRAFPDLHRRRRLGGGHLLLFLFGLSYAAIDETVQYFVPRRDSSFGDWTADAAGYVTAGLVFLLFKLCRGNRSDSN